MGAQNYLNPHAMNQPQLSRPDNYTRPLTDQMSQAQMQPVQPGSYSAQKAGNPMGVQGGPRPFAMQAFHNAVRDRNEMRRQNQKSPGQTGGGRSALNGGRPKGSGGGSYGGY